MTLAQLRDFRGIIRSSEIFAIMSFVTAYDIIQLQLKMEKYVYINNFVTIVKNIKFRNDALLKYTI